jgi:hypothetical protein
MLMRVMALPEAEQQNCAPMPKDLPLLLCHWWQASHQEPKKRKSSCLGTEVPPEAILH